VDALLNTIRSVADGKGVTIAQTVIAWTLEQPGASHALVGARDAVQAVANAKAGEVQLTDQEIKTIRKAVWTRPTFKQNAPRRRAVDIG
jgi:aryl-alcohol dehydrogenase-like predicted oxidoreductase